jgi:hypothetical protein
MKHIAALALLLPACSGSTPSNTLLALADSYTLTGAGRVMPDGVTPTSELAVSFKLALISSGGNVSGKLERAGFPDLAVSGTFDPMTGDLALLPIQGVITGTASEMIQQIGGRGSDAVPADGIADELVGYLRTSRGSWVFDGAVFGVSDIAGRPAGIDGSKVTATSGPGGMARVKGAAGAVTALAGIDSYAFGLRDHDPSEVPAMSIQDGSFDFGIQAVMKDVVMLRPNRAGEVGPATVLMVQ